MNIEDKKGIVENTAEVLTPEGNKEKQVMGETKPEKLLQVQETKEDPVKETKEEQKTEPTPKAADKKKPATKKAEKPVAKPKNVKASVTAKEKGEEKTKTAQSKKVPDKKEPEKQQSQQSSPNGKLFIPRGARVSHPKLGEGNMTADYKGVAGALVTFDKTTPKGPSVYVSPKDLTILSLKKEA